MRRGELVKPGFAPSSSNSSSGVATLRVLRFQNSEFRIYTSAIKKNFFFFFSVRFNSKFSIGIFIDKDNKISKLSFLFF